eukprot:403359199
MPQIQIIYLYIHLKEVFIEFNTRGIAREIYYNQPCLDPQDPKCTADEYFKDITYSVDLTKLYKVLGSCSYSDDMQYCPVLLEIGEERIRQSFNNCPYLIQVWDQKQNKIFELPLHQKIKQWQICYNYFLFVTSGEDSDDGEEYLRIVDLDQSNHVIKVKNFISDQINHISYNHSKLYGASQNKIYLTEIPTSYFEQTETVIDVTQDQIRVIEPGLNIHGLILNEWAREGGYQQIVFETLDNQLDFNRLYTENVTDKDSFTFRYEQTREIIPRVGFQHDPITKALHIFSKGFNYSVTLRQSGKFDLYWNLSRKDSSIDKYAVDVGLSISGFYFKLTDMSQWYFDHEDKSSITFQQAKRLQEDIDFSQIYLKIVQNTVKIFSGFQLVKISQALCLVTHGKFLSFFDILESKWLNHVEFEDDIINLFRLYVTEDDLYQCILLRNGAVYQKVMDYDQYTEVVPTDKRSMKIDGEVIRTCEDLENNHTFYVVVKNNEKIQLKCIQRDSVHNIGVVKPEENLSVVCLQFRSDETHVVIQNGTKLMIYKQFSWSSGPNLKPVFTIEDASSITGSIHSGTAYEVDKHMFLFDEKNFYVVKQKPDSIKVYENVYCIGLQNFTRQFNYCICQDRSDSISSGLRIFDMESIINKDILNMTLLKKIDIGTLGYFEFGSSLARFGFIQSTTHILITPILHRNMNKFMGIDDDSTYICYKVIKDKFIVLTQTGELLTWNVLTGKPLFRNKLSQSYEDYELFSKYKKDAVIIQSKEPISEANTDQFFTPQQLQTITQNQKAFVNTQEFTVRRFKYIEIINEYEVKTHLEYIHPLYDPVWQFINKSKTLLIQRLVNYRMFLYKAVSISRDDPSQIRWEIVRQIIDFPADLDTDSNLLETFTPDFSKYILLSKTKENFIIKDTVSDKKLYTIPRELMMVTHGQNPEHVTNRFQWQDEETFIIVSQDGIEKKVDIQNNFSELQYNYRPLFNDINGKEYEKSIYYTLREDIPINQVLDRLKMCYQQYKTSYFLHDKRLNSDLYQDLLTVDPHKIQWNNHSFTFLHWSLIEQLQKGAISIDELEEKVIEQLLYNILPGGNTILHKLCEREDQLIGLFKIAHPSEEQIKYHVPFLPNLEGHSPIHKCIEKSDYKSIDTILKYLRNYEIDHHSRGIKDLFPIFIKQNLPEFLDYLNVRIMQTEQLQKFNKGCLKEEYPEILVSQLWFDEKALQDQIMTVKPVETRISCQIIDLPSIYHYQDKDFNDFFQELADTEQSAYFNKEVIQKMIEFNYPLVKEYVQKRLFYPYAVFMVFFFLLMNLVIEYKDQQGYHELFYGLLAINVLFATYFLHNEVRQLGSAGIEYFGSFWNYIDIIPPIGIYGIAITSLLQDQHVHISVDLQRTIQAIATFFMWFKFLYFLRIYRSTGYLISMIFEVIKDMKYFFLVLFLTIVAFSDSFLSISYGNTEEKRFTHSFVDSIIYTYRMILGDFDTTEFGEVATPLVMILFLLCTIFNMIVMLNLLIAIISESFAKVTSKSDQAVYQEMASMIAENSYLIPESRKKEYAESGKYLLIVKDLEEINNEEIDDPILDKLEALQKQLQKQIKDIKDDQKSNKKSQDEAIEKIVKQITEDKKDTNIKLGEIKVMLVQQQGTVTINTKIHKHPLQKLTLASLKEKHAKNGGYSTGFVCDGAKYVGCQASDLIRNNDEDELYHCEECSFDECAKCFETFGDVHIHDLEKLTFAQLKEKNSAYNDGWNCDLRNNTGCPHGGKTFDDEYGLVYHHAECGFDLCEKCANTYKLL